MTLPGGRSVPTLVATTLAFFWRGFLDGLSPARAGAGWASRTLVNSLREVVLRAVVSLHVLVLAVVIGQVVGSRPSVGVVAAGAMHLICITVALLALRRPVLGPAFILLTYLGNTLDLLTAPTMASASTFAAIWMLHLTAALSMALIPGRAGIVVPLVGVVVACGVPLLVHPDWESGLFVGAVTATVFIVIATRCGIALLSRLAHQVDEQARVAAAEQRAASWATSAARGTAERGWVLHDTVINTLGAIVRGGAATRDLALVRERCARDAEVVAAMVAGADEPLGGDRGPLAVLEESGLAVEHTGLTPDAVAAASADLPAGQWIAVGRAVHEVLLNVRKHAGVSAVRCDVRRHRGRLHLTVSDAGRGFDPEQVQMRGLSGSVVERCRHVGVDVDVDSRPGGGTSVTFRMGAAKGRGTKAEPQPVGELVIGLRQRAVWAWAWGCCWSASCWSSSTARASGTAPRWRCASRPRPRWSSGGGTIRGSHSLQGRCCCSLSPVERSSCSR
ncbi:sensor histidine kinase [Nocardioides alcanivorans]|uniref:sensor histidine kinase n=1 Tax=Nocardioides alcanivorans TaxID=2897352 RepID=UPI001F275B4B|nr:ATP-binding protein [Nocardioides alcanivorans]